MCPVSYTHLLSWREALHFITQIVRALGHAHSRGIIHRDVDKRQAVPSLKALVEAGHEVLGVFTQPDKPKNRGMKLLPTPVKEYALTHNIPVYQPDKLKDGQTLDTLRQMKPEMIVVAAYGRILPVEILELPPLGCVNVHSSLLPKYRGAAPINWAILNGEKETGVTIMYLSLIHILPGDEEDFVFSPEPLLVSGQESLVNQVAYALVTVDGDERTQTVSDDFSYQLIGASGDVLTDLDVTCDTETVYTTFPIYATARCV